MMLQIRSLLILLMFAVVLLPVTGTAAPAFGLFQDDEFRLDEDDDQLEDSEDQEEDWEDEDEEEFMDNPWRIDERKLFAAKKFQLTHQFALKVKQIENICGELDKKQKLKLAVASKGATEQALEKFIDDWKEQMKQFGGAFQINADDDNDDDQKKKKKRKKKKIVIKRVEEIDVQVMQMLDQSIFGGQKQDYTNSALWERTVRKVLNEDQQEKLAAHVKKQSLAKRNARAESFVADMKLKLALSDEQAVEFDQLVRPAFLKKDIDTSWSYEGLATLYLGSKYDKKKMKELLSEEQRTVLEMAVKPAESYGGMFGNNNAGGGAAAPVVEGLVSGVVGAISDTVEEIVDVLISPLEGFFKWEGFFK